MHNKCCLLLSPNPCCSTFASTIPICLIRCSGEGLVEFPKSRMADWVATGNIVLGKVGKGLAICEDHGHEAHASR
ncbi:hypothetical protein QUC31_016189 [Theobroma cacao]